VRMRLVDERPLHARGVGVACCVVGEGMRETKKKKLPRNTDNLQARDCSTRLLLPLPASVWLLSFVVVALSLLCCLVPSHSTPLPPLFSLSPRVARNTYNIMATRVKKVMTQPIVCYAESESERHTRRSVLLVSCLVTNP
jgi:hypothetical protein